MFSEYIFIIWRMTHKNQLLDRLKRAHIGNVDDIKPLYSEIDTSANW